MTHPSADGMRAAIITALRPLPKLIDVSAMQVFDAADRHGLPALTILLRTTPALSASLAQAARGTYPLRMYTNIMGIYGHISQLAAQSLHVFPNELWAIASLQEDQWATHNILFGQGRQHLIVPRVSFSRFMDLYGHKKNTAVIERAWSHTAPWARHLVTTFWPHTRTDAPPAPMQLPQLRVWYVPDELAPGEARHEQLRQALFASVGFNNAHYLGTKEMSQEASWLEKILREADTSPTSD